MFYYFSILLILLLSACSTKKVYDPKVLAHDWNKHSYEKESIVDTSYNVALLSDNSVLSKSGNVDVRIKDSFRIVAKSDGWIVSTSLDGNLTLQKNDTNLTKDFALKKTIASASAKDDKLAVLFADNEIALYHIGTKEPFFKQQGSESTAVNTKIVNPFFIEDLVIFSTLDGKVVIVNTKLKKKLRSVIVSSEDHFNNVIYFTMIGNKIVAATGYKILSMSEKELRAKYEIRDILYDGSNLYVDTKQGEVVSLTPNLEINAKIKFPFAHFLGMISDGDKLYILEKEGYIIVLDKNMKDFTVHEVELEDGFIFVADKAFYVKDEKISIK